MKKAPNHSIERTNAGVPMFAAHVKRSPGRFASGRTRQLSRELLPAATRRENKELKTDAPSGHGLAAALLRHEVASCTTERGKKAMIQS